MATELTATTQFITLNQVIPFASANSATLVSISPVTPKNIALSNTSNATSISWTITGYYGEDITPDHEFYVRTGNTFQTYTSYTDLQNSNYDHIIKFSPDSSHHKIITYTFNVNSNNSIVTQEFTQYVHMDPSAWVGRLQSIVAIEVAKHSAGLI
jgi:hypothetical protein